MKALVLAFVLLALVPRTASAEPAAPRLAVVIAAPWDGEQSMSNDAVAATAALRGRGLVSGDIVVLQGALDRDGVMALFRTVSRRIASWKRGEVVLVVSAHGTFTGTTAADARPGLLLSRREPALAHTVFWDEIFNALNVPDGVQVVLLPDT